MALQRYELPFRIVRASTWEPDSARAELLAANAMGQTPTLVDTLGWSGTRAHLASSRPALLAALLAVEARPELQPVFRRHRSAAPT